MVMSVIGGALIVHFGCWIAPIRNKTIPAYVMFLLVAVGIGLSLVKVLEKGKEPPPAPAATTNPPTTSAPVITPPTPPVA